MRAKAKGGAIGVSTPLLRCTLRWRRPNASAGLDCLAAEPCGGRRLGMPRRLGQARPRVLEAPPMSDFMVYYLVPAAVIAVAMVLLLGLINMMRGGSPDRSQKLMRLRVLLQFVAIVAIMATIWVMHR